MIPEDVHQVYGSIPARALWFHARRLDPTKGGKQTGESLAWSPPGESVQATSWPVEELTPTMLLDRWGPGRYRLQWVGAGASGGRRAMGQSQVVDVRPPDETAKRRRRASAEERTLPLPNVEPSPHAARPTDDARDAYRIAAEMMRDQDARAHSRQAEIAAQAQAQVVQLVQLSAAMVPKADAGAALAPALDRLAAALESQGRTLETLAKRVDVVEAFARELSAGDDDDDDDDDDNEAPPPQDLAATVQQVLPVLMMLGESLKAGSAPAAAPEKLAEKAAE